MPLQNLPLPSVRTSSADPFRRFLEERFEHLVHQRTNGMVQELSVCVLGKRVVLNGKAGSYYTKQLATHAVLHAAGEYRLQNNIRVA